MSDGNRLSGHPTGFIKKHILTNPSDPRYAEALQELKNRGETPDIVIIPDEVIEKMLTYPGWEKLLPPPGEKITWIKSTAAKALGNVNPGNKSQCVSKSKINWYLRCVEDSWILEDVELL